MQRLVYCVVLLLLSFCTLSWAESTAAVATILTDEEHVWIEQHPLIRVSAELDWPPINFVENGQSMGFSVEYIKLVAEKVGIQLEFIPGNWSELLQKSYDKELDVMLNIVNNNERAKYLLFTGSYACTPTAIFSHINNQQFHHQLIF